MFKNVIVGVDGGANGRDAIALARDLSGAHARLTLATVNAVDPKLVPDASQYNEIADQMAQKLLQDARNAVGVDADLRRVSARTVGSGLHLLAEESEADLLVVGSCSHTFAGRVFLGSDTHDTVKDAPCAVAVASKDYAKAGNRIRSIGVGYDESRESEGALSVARELAARHTATVTVLEVVSAGAYAYGGVAFTSPAPALALADSLEQATERLKALEGVEGRAAYGGVGQELVILSNEVDLLVLGSRHTGRLARVLLGSASGYVAEHAHCPVLIVPRPVDHEHGAHDQESGPRVRAASAGVSSKPDRHQPAAGSRAVAAHPAGGR